VTRRLQKRQARAAPAATPAAERGDRAELERLRHLGFFRDFTTAEIRRLLRLGLRRTFRQGDLLATEGTRKQRRILYVVLAGRLEYARHVRAARTATLLRLAPGDVGGFLTFFNDDASPVSVRSVGTSEVLEIGRPEFARLLAASPGLAAKVLFALLRMTVAHTEALLEREAETAAWALDLEHHLRQLPVHRDA